MQFCCSGNRTYKKADGQTDRLILEKVLAFCSLQKQTESQKEKKEERQRQMLLDLVTKTPTRYDKTI